jgi:hypothetical protein
LCEGTSTDSRDLWVSKIKWVKKVRKRRWGRKWVTKVICGEEEKKRKRVWGNMGRKWVKKEKVICG